MLRLAGRLTPSRGFSAARVVASQQFLRPASGTASTTDTKQPAEPPTAISEASSTPVDVREQPPLTDAQMQGQQAPNRLQTWSRSQRARKDGMVGPRFEQTDFALQPRPMAAIELIHEQPVRFIPGRVAVCDGGGGPLGHPKIFINVDKPEINTCGYCGLPYANLHHKEAIKSNNPEFPILD